MLSIVDNRTFRRLVFEVLEGNPTQADVERFLGHFWALLTRRGLSVKGITTDGSSLYPEPIARVFGNISHQICEFHVIKDITYAVLRAVAQVRKALTAKKTRLPLGCPRKGPQRRLSQFNARIQRKVGDLYEHRFLFVRRELTIVQRATLERITRGLPSLRPLREIIEEVYRLFDRRCRTETALTKLACLRRRVGRFDRLRRVLRTLFGPTLEKALTFLDDKLLPSTSNAVERGNRRHRKMQASIYRARTRAGLVGRMALDLARDEHLIVCREAVGSLHAQRHGRPPGRRRGATVHPQIHTGRFQRRAG